MRGSGPRSPSSISFSDEPTLRFFQGIDRARKINSPRLIVRPWVKFDLQNVPLLIYFCPLHIAEKDLGNQLFPVRRTRYADSMRVFHYHSLKKRNLPLAS